MPWISMDPMILLTNIQLFKQIGGFNPSEKYESKWESSPIFGVKIKNL